MSGETSTPHQIPEDSSLLTTTGVANQNDTTQFIDDGIVTTRDESMINHIDMTILSLSDTQGAQQDIINFLQKPILLTNGIFSTTDTYSFLNSFSMPLSAFNATQGIIWKQKLAGFFGIRMDMRFRIVTNANRFQQGRYCIGWVPLASPQQTTSNFKNILVNNMHMATLKQRTTVPHVELDLCTGTSAELLVPFVSVQNFYPLNTIISSGDLASLGYINIYPYYPLTAASGSTTAGYSLYVSFEKITLFGAASAQSGISDREVSNKGNGPISSVAGAVSRGFKEFESIPLISSYAHSISWISDRIAKTATMFGFSKPLQGDSSTKMMLVNGTNHTTVDGDSDARSLSFLSKPGVTRVEGQSGTHFDEMDFAYIIQKYAWLQTVAWTSSTTVGNISSIEVRPDIGVDFVASNFHYIPLAFVARFFNYWRGSIKYRIKIVKTEFHSGRLSIAFYPTDELALIGNPAYVNRMIVDIRETSEIEIVIPYISRTPWTARGIKIGYLSIDVVDILTAPATVSSSIQLLIESSGGSDMEFAVPAPFDANVSIINPQSGIGEPNDQKIISTTIGNSSINSNPNLMSAIAIGDKISNFRTYLKRYHPIRPSDKLTTSSNALNTVEVSMYPDAILAQLISPVGDIWESDMYSLLASCYAIVSGGIRIRNVVDTGLLNSTNNSINSNMYTSFALELGAASVINPIRPVGTTTPISGNLPNFYQNTLQNNIVSVEIPQYTQTMGRAKADIITYQGGILTYYGYNATTGSSNTHGQVAFTLPTSSLAGATFVNGYTVHNLHRSLADDGNFSCFISIPPQNGLSTGAAVKGLY